MGVPKEKKICKNTTYFELLNSKMCDDKLYQKCLEFCLKMFVKFDEAECNSLSEVSWKKSQF